MNLFLLHFSGNSAQGRHYREEQWCPVPPFKICAPLFHVWPPGCCIHPILYWKMCPPCGFWHPCCEILATGLIPRFMLSVVY